MVSSTLGGMDLSEHFFEKFIENDTSGRLRDVRMHDCAASTEAIAVIVILMAIQLQLVLLVLQQQMLLSKELNC